MQVQTNDLFEKNIEYTNGRREIAKTFLGFCLTYLPHYFTLPRADFHPDLMALLEGKDQFIAITGFRGSAKSSLAGLAYILWSALEKKSYFIIPINETGDVVKMTIANLREELETNEQLKADYGDLIINVKNRTAFNESNILLANGVRIMGRSRGQKIRGLRHKQYRPDLVIGDDLEELEKVDKKTYRDKTENWIKNAIIPAIEEEKGRLIIIGNMLHTDALMARLKAHKLFIYRDYPLSPDGTWEKCTWKGKYPTKEAFERQQAKVGRTSWLREYLLKVVPPEGQEIKEEWIQYYDALPQQQQLTGTGVDLAISKKETADFTAMVTGATGYVNDKIKIFILPNPVEERLSFHETIQQIKSLALAHTFHQFYVEAVSYQQAAIEELQRSLINVVAMRPGSDKRARLRAIATYVQNGIVVFPRTGCEDLIDQLLNFGVAEHDDLVDAFVYLLLGLVNSGLQRPEVYAL